MDPVIFSVQPGGTSEIRRGGIRKRVVSGSLQQSRRVLRFYGPKDGVGDGHIVALTRADYELYP